MGAVTAGGLGGMLSDPLQSAQGLATAGLPQMFRSGPKLRRTVKLGLAMRFQVIIDDVPIGLWRSCRGLRADFQPDLVRVTGDHVGQYYLPGEVSYAPIVLERAVHRESSAELQKWLVGVLESWRDGTGDAKRGTARITVLDADGEPAASWLLYGVRPSSWSGPDLNADVDQVAVERLELVHEGFLELPGKADSATLADKAMPSNKVTFSYNPAKMGITRSTRTSQTIGGNVEVATDNTLRNTLRVMAGEVLLAGAGVAQDVQTLIEFSGQPKSGTRAAGDGNKSASAKPVLPLLTFTWGKLDMHVNLSTLDVKLTRFAADGRPIRALATLDLAVVDGEIFPKGTGVRPPARVVQTDPSQWRARAAHKGIDDPMRAAARSRR